MISNSTISSVTKATEASAVEGADVSSVVRVQRAAMETGQGFNNKYVKKSQEVIENNRQALKDDADIIGKASTAVKVEEVNFMMKNQIKNIYKTI